jgi:hypothetical protein
MNEKLIAPKERNKDDAGRRELTYVELREEVRRKDEQREKAEQARLEAASAAHAQALADMIAMPVADKANTQLAVLTNGVRECMRVASLHLDATESHDIGLRASIRRAEIRDAALLSMASARILEAHTQLQLGLNRQAASQSMIRQRVAKGAQALFISHEITPRLGIPADFGITGELVDAALAKERVTAENAKG